MRSGKPDWGRNSTKPSGWSSASSVGQLRSRYSCPSAIPHTSMLTVPGSIPTTRVIALLLFGDQLFSGDRLFPGDWLSGSNQLPCDLGDGLRVQNQVVAGKQPLDAGLV